MPTGKNILPEDFPSDLPRIHSCLMTGLLTEDKRLYWWIIIVPSLLIRSRQDEPFCSLLYERFGLGSLYLRKGCE